MSLALPTPDLLVGSISLLPVLFTAVAGALGTLALRVRRRVAQSRDPQRFLARVAVGLAVAWAATAVGFFVYYMASRADPLVDEMTVYYRCDLAVHELRNETPARRALLQAPDRNVAASFLRSRFQPGYQPVLLQIGSLIQYDAGMAGVEVRGKPQLFQLVYPSDLKAVLRAIPATSRAERDLYLTGRYVLQLLPVPEDAELLALLGSFRSWHIIRSGLTYWVTGEDGRTVRARATLVGQRGWNVRPFYELLEEEVVSFENLATLLDTRATDKALDDRAVAVVAPYNSALRSETVEREFLTRQLFTRLRPPPGADPLYWEKMSGEDAAARMAEANVFTVDFASPTYAEDTARLGALLVGREVVLYGFTKWDWQHWGLDVIYRARLAAAPRPFHYRGAVLNGAEYAARKAVQEASWRAPRRMLTATQAATDRVVAALGRALGSRGAALMVLSMTVRAVQLPLSIPAARSRGVREALRRQSLPRVLEALAEARWGARRGLELASGALALLLLVPAYPLLVHPQAALTGAPFLWVADLLRPDAGMALVLSALVGAALLLGGPPRPTWRRWTLVAGAAVLVFVAIARVPAAVVVHGAISTAFGLALTSVVRKGEDEVNAAWAVAGPPLPNRDALVVDLAEAGPAAGGKASALGSLVRQKEALEPLFGVPDGLVVATHKLDDDGQGGETWTAALQAPVATRFGHAPPPLAVRSSALGEDGVLESQAGRYLSVLDVAPEALGPACHRVAGSYGASALRPVLVQAMAPTRRTGVLFTRSPRNQACMEIEFAEGSAVDLVSGIQTPGRALVSRWTGRLAREGEGAPVPTEGPWQRHLALAGLALEAHFGCPQDVEWTYDPDARALHVVQSRPITTPALGPVVAEEQERVLLWAQEQRGSLDPPREGLGEKEPPLLIPSEALEVVLAPSPFTASFLERVYGEGGPLGRARRRLSLPSPGSAAGVVVAFGRLFAPGPALSPNPWRGVLAAVSGGWSRWTARRRAERNAAAEATVLRRLLDGAETASCSASGDAQTIARGILAELPKVDALYEGLFTANLLAQLLARTPGDLVGPGDDAGARYRKALKSLASDEGRQAFLRVWGHRGRDDYEISTASFAEDPSSLPSPSCATSVRLPPPAASPASTFVGLREDAKDLAVRGLRRLRGPLLALARALELSEASDVFALTLADLGDLATGEAPAVVAARAVASAHRWQTLRSLPLPRSLTIADVELLGEAPLGERRARSAGGAPLRGDMLSVPRSFEGRLVADDEALPIDGPAVLLAEHLVPALVDRYGEIAGVVTAAGGLLSHAAVVARERGVPVLRLSGARELLRLGDTVTVSADGEVVIKPS